MSGFYSIVLTVRGVIAYAAIPIPLIGTYVFYKNRTHPAIFYRCSSVNLFGIYAGTINALLAGYYSIMPGLDETLLLYFNSISDMTSMFYFLN